MRGPTFGLIAIFVAAFGISASAFAQQPGASRGMPDLSGIWARAASASGGGILADDANGAPFLGFTKDILSSATLAGGGTKPR